MSGSTTYLTTTTGNTAADHAGLVLLLQANCPQQINQKFQILKDYQLETDY